jgi:hypothetical protein
MNWRGFGRKPSGPLEHLLIFGELPIGGSTELQLFGEFCSCYEVFITCCVNYILCHW